MREVVKIYVTPVNRVRRMVAICGVLFTRRHPVCVNGQWMRAVDAVSATFYACLYVCLCVRVYVCKRVCVYVRVLVCSCVHL